MKKITLFFLIIFLGGLFFPLISLAGTYELADGRTVTYEGLVPCGKIVTVNGGSQYIACQFCHFFVMIDGIIDFVLKYIVIPVAVLMLVVGGIMFFFAGASPTLMGQAKKLITSVIMGLVIIFAAYLIIGFVLAMMGLADTNPLKDWLTGNSFTINCPIELPSP